MLEFKRTRCRVTTLETDTGITRFSVRIFRWWITLWRNARLIPRAERSKELVMNIPCPHCYGGHFRPCQTCGDSGTVEFVPNPVIHLSDDTRKSAEENPAFAKALFETIEAVLSAVKKGELKP